MSNISEIDKNFKIDTSISKEDILFYNARVAPFKIYGVFYDNGKYRRMPTEIARSVSPGVYSLHANTAGGRVRFRTNSPYIAISAKMVNIGKMPHFALCGSAGFDMYIDGLHRHSYQPPFNITDGYEGIVDMLGGDMKEVVINFPLYSDVTDLFIGLSKDAEVLKATPYSIEKPIVYYGSSVTQGGCASRPGTAYQGFISRDLDADFINLGFSGNARAESEMYNYIKSLDMSVFVMDYDYNSPSLEHLEATHEKMFLAIREAQPKLPVVMMSAPKAILSPLFEARRAVVYKTYENAIKRGDENVYFIDGPELMSVCGDEGTVDITHPTDLGFFSMATALRKVLTKILK